MNSGGIFYFYFEELNYFFDFEFILDQTVIWKKSSSPLIGPLRQTTKVP